MILIHLFLTLLVFQQSPAEPIPASIKMKGFTRYVIRIGPEKSIRATASAIHGTTTVAGYARSSSTRQRLSVIWPAGDADSLVLRATRRSEANTFIGPDPSDFDANTSELLRMLRGDSLAIKTIKHRIYGSIVQRRDTLARFYVGIDTSDTGQMARLRGGLQLTDSTIITMALERGTMPRFFAAFGMLARVKTVHFVSNSDTLAWLKVKPPMRFCLQEECRRYAPVLTSYAALWMLMYMNGLFM